MFGKKQNLKTVSAETAQKQLDDFFEYYGYDNEQGFLDAQKQDDADAFSSTFERIKRGIKMGFIDISENEDGEISVTQVTKKGSELVFPEISAKNKSEMRAVNEFTKIHQLAGSMTGVGYEGICKLKGSDLSNCESIATLFLLV